MRSSLSIRSSMCLYRKLSPDSKDEEACLMLFHCTDSGLMNVPGGLCYASPSSKQVYQFLFPPASEDDLI